MRWERSIYNEEAKQRAISTFRVFFETRSYTRTRTGILTAVAVFDHIIISIVFKYRIMFSYRKEYTVTFRK